MFNFKKTLSVIIVLFVLIGSVACSKVDKNYGVNDKENEMTENVEDDAVIMSLDRVMSTYFDISLFDEENYSEIYLGKKFTIDATFCGLEFKVPTTLKELSNNGWVLADGNSYNENSLIFSNETVNATFTNENGTMILAEFYNSSRSSIKIKECNIVKFKIINNYYDSNDGYDEFDVNGITNSMAITDIIDTLGIPSHFYAVSDNCYYLDYFITKKDRRNGITVYINPLDDTILSIEFSFYK